MASSSQDFRTSNSQLLNDGDEGEEFESPYQVYRRLTDIVINETVAPELLPFEESIVECILDQIQHMSDNLKKYGRKLETFCAEQHQIELERFSYVINNYYRTRIKKIETDAPRLITILKTDSEKASKLFSDLEMRFLDKYLSSVDSHLNRTVLQKLPPNMRSFRMSDVRIDDKKQFDANYVFVKALKETSVVVDDPLMGQEVVHMDKGSQHFLPFSAIRTPLHNSSQDLLLL